MKKIPTIFERDWDDDRSRVVNVWHKDCAWVRDGEGVATRKIDGTSCLVRDGKLFKRREVKKGQTPPSDFELATHDAETGKAMGWVPVGDGPEDTRHREAFDRLVDRRNGTYELIGPSVQGNPEHADSHMLAAHADCEVLDAPREFDALASWLAGKDIEGLVWHHADGRMAKIKLRDFGLKRGA
jgi:hypothetical protein